MKKRKEEVELKNKAESFINSIDEGLKEKGASMDAKQKEETEKLRDELKKALDANDMDTLRSKISELEKAAEMMAQMQADQGGKPEETATDSKDNSGSKGDDVVDADFTEDKKK